MSTKLLSQLKYPDAIDIDIRNLKYALKEFIKQKRRIKYSLYFKYRSNFYFFNYCSVPILKYDLQMANTNSCLLY